MIESFELQFHEVPAEVRQAVEPLIEKHCAIIPRWMRFLHVRFYGQGKASCQASTHVEHPYRWSTIYVYGAFLEGDERAREHDVVHEMFHVLIGPPQDYALREIKRAISDQNHREAIVEEYQQKVEALVEDMTNDYLAGKFALAGGGSI